MVFGVFDYSAPNWYVSRMVGRKYRTEFGGIIALAVLVLAMVVSGCASRPRPVKGPGTNDLERDDFHLRVHPKGDAVVLAISRRRPPADTRKHAARLVMFGFSQCFPRARSRDVLMVAVRYRNGQAKLYTATHEDYRLYKQRSLDLRGFVKRMDVRDL